MQHDRKNGLLFPIAETRARQHTQRSRISITTTSQGVKISLPLPKGSGIGVLSSLRMMKQGTRPVTDTPPYLVRVEFRQLFPLFNLANAPCSWETFRVDGGLGAFWNLSVDDPGETAF